MKLIKQAFFIFGISYIGNTISAFINNALPGSIIGIAILFTLLYFKIIKIDDVDDLGSWLQKYMALLFVPITVGLMEEYDIIAPHLLDLTIIMVVSTAITYIVVVKIVEKVRHD